MSSTTKISRGKTAVFALAGVLVVASYNLIDWRALHYHLRATRFDAAIVGVTALAAIGISIEFCVLVGVLMSMQ